MASLEIENIGRRPYIRRVLNVTITYDTPPKKINQALEILREILSVPDATNPDTSGSPAISAGNESSEGESEKERHPNDAINQPEFPPRIFFSDLNSDSLNLLVIYWYHPADYWDYLEHATCINVQIMERFKAEGLNFAFPTQTLHLAGDDERPLTIGQRWESDQTNTSPNAKVAQPAVFGAQTVLAQQAPASDSIRPEPNAKTKTDAKFEGELTEAPIENDLMQSGDPEDEVGER